MDYRKNKSKQYVFIMFNDSSFRCVTNASLKYNINEDNYSIVSYLFRIARYGFTTYRIQTCFHFF